MAVDVHQHVWPAALIDALRDRSVPPRLRGWTLELPGEPEHRADPADHDPGERAALAAGEGLDLALVSLSSALGIETLPAGEAQELLDAYHEGALSLPRPFRAWAAACLTEVDRSELERRLDQGFVGLQLPATTLLDAQGYGRVAPLLRALEERGAPLFVHPGPAGIRAGDLPAWWAALVPYVQQMHAAWFAFRVHGRPAHPNLRVCFAMLAGLAPLHGERFHARGGERAPVDPGVFLDVSSYGTRAVDATVRVLGTDALVNGSDRPYAVPAELELGDHFAVLLRETNPLRLIEKREVINVLDVASAAQS